MRFRIFSYLIASALAALALMQGHAIAAPQILGLVALAQPITLKCEDGVCKAEFSTVCLQEHRKSPVPGTAYKASGLSSLTLAVAGKQIDVTRLATIKSVRNFSAVSISLPERMVAMHGAMASLKVAAMSSLIPVAKPGDADPHSAAEILRYTGPLRSVAKRVFHDESSNIAALADLNRVINIMPDRLGDDAKGFEKVWRTVSAGKSAQRLSAAVVQSCRHEFKRGMLTTMRSCIVY